MRVNKKIFPEPDIIRVMTNRQIIITAMAHALLSNSSLKIDKDFTPQTIANDAKEVCNAILNLERN
jgi:hypothetical protein